MTVAIEPIAYSGYPITLKLIQSFLLQLEMDYDTSYFILEYLGQNFEPETGFAANIAFALREYSFDVGNNKDFMPSCQSLSQIICSFRSDGFVQ